MVRTHQWPTWELETEFQPAGATAVPRSLAAAVSPMLSGALLAISTFGWPLILAGGLKIAYDLLLLILYRKKPLIEDI